MRLIAIGAGAGACAGSLVGSAEAIHVLLSSLPAEYQAVGAAWTLYGAAGAAIGLLVGLTLLPFRQLRAESAWCTAFVLVGTPLAGLLTLHVLDAGSYGGGGVPTRVAAELGTALVVLAAITGWMGRNILQKTPLRILATVRGTTAAWSAGLLLAWVFALSPAPTPVQKLPPSARAAAGGPDIVLVVVDALRADALGAYGAPPESTPNADALAREGVVFEQAVAASTNTRSAVASLYTSLAVSSHGCERPGDFLSGEPLTLAEAVADRGYVTLGFPNQPSVSGSRGFGQGFESYVYSPNYPLGAAESTASLFAYGLLRESLLTVAPELAAAPVHTASSVLVDRALAALAAHAPTPAMVVLQLVEPLPVPARGAPPEGDVVLPRIETEAQAHVANVRVVDEALGRLVAGLRDLGRYDRTLIVLTADRGAPSIPGLDGRGTMRDESVHIPLVVKLPDGEWAGTRVPWQVRSIDIAPTLLDVAGARPPSQWQGVELFTDSFEDDLALLQVPDVDGEVPAPVWHPPDWTIHPASRDALVESTVAGVTHRALRRGGVKVVATLLASGSEEETPADLEFYDLISDPTEEHDQSAVQSTRQAGMRAAMESMVADRRRKAVGRPPAPWAEGVDRCGRCALGYLAPEECGDCAPGPSQP